MVVCLALPAIMKDQVEHLKTIRVAVMAIGSDEEAFSNSLIIHAALTQPGASYSGQVDEFRNPMKNELKTWPCLKPVFEVISNTDANFLNLHIDKARKTRGDKQLFNQRHILRNKL